MKGGIETHEMDASRLASGEWNARSQKLIGEGDVWASYSGDRIGMGQPIRRPFTWRGALWVCTGMAGKRGEITAEVYKLVDVAVFRGTPTIYAEKTRDAESARRDPMGFYHGMTFKCRGAELVLCGPPVRLVPRQVCQPNLFEPSSRYRTKQR